MSDTIDTTAELPPVEQDNQPPAEHVAEVETTEAEPKPPAEGVKEIKAEPAKPKASDRRFAQLTARIAAQEAELATLRPKPVEGSPEAIQAQVEARAAQMVQEREFNQNATKVVDAGRADYPDYMDAMGRLSEAFPPGPGQTALIEAAMEAGDAHKVLYALSQDTDEAERIMGLSPARMGAALAKLAVKAAAPVNALTATPSPAPKPVSQAPAPIKPLEKGGGRTEPRLDADSQEEFEKAYAIQEKKLHRA